MSRTLISRDGRLRRLIAATLLFSLVDGGAHRAPAEAPDPAQSISFPMSRTIAEAGATRVIPFLVAAPAAEDRTFPCAISNAGVAEVIREPSVLAGQAVGYVRIRALRAGAAALHLGEATLELEVVDARPAVWRGAAPVLIGPSAGAVIWGTVAAGVEVRVDATGPLRRVVLRGPGALERTPRKDTERAYQPFRQLLFDVDVAELPAGPIELTPVAIDAAGCEQAGGAVRVLVVRPSAGEVWSGEAEARYELERPERFRDERKSVGRDPRASGGSFFVNAAPTPAMCFPLDVAQPGAYQLVLVAGGTRAQGVLPTVGVVVDGAEYSRTNGRLLSEGWHRLSIGVPFRLEPGRHVISPIFVNDFYVPRAVDRNLYLDRIEIARVPDAGAAVDGDAGAMMSMSAPAMPMTAASRPLTSPSAMSAPTRDATKPTAPDGAMSAAAGAGAGMSSGAPADAGGLDPYATAATPLRVALTRPLDGATLPGIVEVQGRCWWDGVGRVAPPVVTLVVNDRPVARQRSASPRFWVDVSNFWAGPNRFQLVAQLDNGASDATPAQTLTWPAAAVEEAPPHRQHLRFTVHEERWSADLRPRLGEKNNAAERLAAGFFAQGEAVLELPEELAGSFEVFVELLGEHFDGPPRAVVSVRVDGEETPVGAIDAPTWWDTRRAGMVELTPGPKQLVVAFANDKYEKDKGDRNLWFQAVTLSERRAREDDTPPVIEVRYPPDGHEAFLVDAFVAEASDNASLRSAELVVDGVETGLVVGLHGRPGRIVLPLLLRNLDPGRHTFAVRVTDLAGNTTLSEPRALVVRGAAPRDRGRYERAVHLLNRFAYGPDADELAALLTMGEAAWLGDRLTRGSDDPGDLAALGAGVAHFPNRNEYDVPRRAIAHLLLTPNPLRARFVLWAQNHFSTWIRKANGVRKWDEHVAFAQLGTARFDALLRASAQSPAMLAYLDQDTSFVGRMNENYAREIMELHTLGVDGGYSQADVTNLARILTGWTVALEGDGQSGGPFARTFSYRFDPALSDGAAVDLVGLRFPDSAADTRFDRAQLTLELLAAHPSTARHVARQLAEHYVSVPPPDDLVDDLARNFMASGGDLAALLRAIATHPRFWDAANRERLADPLSFAVRLCRTAAHPQPWLVADFLDRSGHGLFDRPTPDGYPEDDTRHADSNALLQRWRLARELSGALAALVPGAWRGGDSPAEPRWAQLVVDLLAARLTGGVLSDASNTAALEFLGAVQGNRDERVRALGPFLAQLPEANLR